MNSTCATEFFILGDFYLLWENRDCFKWIHHPCVERYLDGVLERLWLFSVTDSVDYEYSIRLSLYSVDLESRK